ncbi:MAG: hypothetical protein ACETWM_14895 [Candidatus Lokiarchaeia archaeon]
MLGEVPDSSAVDACFWTTYKSYVSRLREIFLEVWKNSNPVTKNPRVGNK